MSDCETLISMGFPESHVSKALSSTKNSGLSPALDFLEKNADQTEEWWTSTWEGAAGGDDEDEAMEGVVQGDEEAKSLRCTECGKIFKNAALAQFHGTKSGHTSFEESTEEIKPLTEEEKAEKLKELKTKMEEKRKIQAKKDAEEAKVNEAIRRKGGKDQQQLKQELQLKEAEKAAIQRKKDKADEVAARKRIKDQIEADKKARAEKTAREKALREGRNPDEAVEQLRNPSSTSSSLGGTTLTPEQAVANTESKEKKTYDGARLQLRVPSGPPVVHNAQGTDTLRSVWEFVKSQTGLENPSLTSSFPRKTFGEADLDKSLSDLGLTPSAVLMVSGQ
ncbi:uncharacterized protein JCM6883_004429 [Sporobolomyces salmoneus]|uniref:uncharacterized protein n=1 Tax=Sporobolomyces salmoneus TaxID=183962 RepID=UPI003174F6C0